MKLSYLRTKEQLGYMVRSQIFNSNNNYYLMIKVQSEKDVDFVKGKIDNFIKYFKSYFISKISEKDELEKIKSTIYKLINTESNSGYNLFLKYYKEIVDERYFFNKDIVLSNQLDNITKDDMIVLLIKYFKKIIIVN